MPEKTLQQMTDEIREINVAKGWRPAEGGPGGNTWGDYVALLHSEVSEALEAYRDHRLDAATIPHCAEPTCVRHGTFVTASACARKADGSWHRTVPGKPEGVGSELADVLIRLLDMADVFGFVPYDMDMELGDVADAHELFLRLDSFGDHLAWIHHRIDNAWEAPAPSLPHVLRALVTVARKHGIDLDAEYERKVAYNRTRAFRHGGRALTDDHA